MGAGFVFFNTQINFLRKKYLTNKITKTAEGLVVILATATIWYFSPMVNNRKCMHDPNESEETQKSYLCGDGSFNPIASLLYNT